MNARALAVSVAVTVGALAVVTAPCTLPTPVDHRTGAIWRPQPSPDARAPRLHRLTAYCACPLCCGRWADGRTASGTWARAGRTLAADPRIWERGQCLRFPGLDRGGTVEDTGSAILGARIDVYMDSHAEALRFGVRWEPVVECAG